ncbi:MAG: MATE family efflux transporter, partial [Candidatus Omnitrophica bacterium COP1]|nr:MATE family efflux transporter [Candidatus Omnitrophica bacterium COP1]
MNEGVVQDNYLKPGGYREILKISFPLIMSTSSFSLMHVVDRIFLSWYSPESLAASMPAGAAAWSIMSLFIGTTSYVSTFVSQYDGAQRPQRIGAVIWQGIYLSLIASAILVFGFLVAEPLFNLAGHDPAVRKEEITYFNVLIVGSGGMIFSSALSAFYAGRGKTWIIMWVNMAGSLMNGVLDYFFIFGKWGFPEMGIFGAGLATVIAPWCITLFYFCLLFLRRNREQFGTLAHWRIDRELFGRLLRYGLPSGLQWMTDITAFTV